MTLQYGSSSSSSNSIPNRIQRMKDRIHEYSPPPPAIGSSGWHIVFSSLSNVIWEEEEEQEEEQCNFTTLRPRQNGRHFPEDIFKCIFFNENLEFRLEIHRSLLLKGSNYQYRSIGSDDGFAPTRRQAII